MLVILATHPIQYQVPVWKSLAERKQIPFEVWYLTKHGIEPSFDSQFGQVLKWDLDLLGGYPYRFPSDQVSETLGGFWDVRLPDDFRQRLTSGQVKAVLVHGWNKRACWEAVYFARRSGVQVWMRGESNDLKVDSWAKRLGKRWLVGNLLRRVDYFLYVGEANRRLYQSYGTADTQLAPGPYGVDNERFAVQVNALREQRQSLRRSWGVPDDAFCLLYVGKFIAKKRPLDLVAAVSHLSKSDPARNYHLLFVGVGELGPEVRRGCRVIFDGDKKMASDSPAGGPAPSASFTGFLNQTEVSKAYVAADALVLPSDARETWGLVVNEAMASGLPCVVSAACGSSEDLVAPLDPQLTYPCGDVPALAASIRHLAESPIGADAISDQIARYDFKATVHTLEGLWSKVVGS